MLFRSVGKATGSAADATAITSISPEFADNAPLWTYILAESVASAYRVRDGHIVGPQVRPFRLGPVGGRIVAETIVGLLSSDPASIISRREPDDPRDRIKALFDRIADGNVSMMSPRPRTVGGPAQL